MSNTSYWWIETEVGFGPVICQEVSQQISKDIWSENNYIFRSHSSSMLFLLALILTTATTCSFLFKPLRMPFLSLITAGVILGTIHGKVDVPSANFLYPLPLKFTLDSFSFIGFTCYSFMLGVETNRDAIKSIGRKAFVVGFVGLLMSLLFSFLTFSYLQKTMTKGFNPMGLSSLGIFNATSFFMVCCSHLNDLGISNSDLGRFAASTSLVLDIFGLIGSFVITNFVTPLFRGGKVIWKPLVGVLYYFLLFFVGKPLIVHIVSWTPEGRPMKQNHFFMIILLVISISFIGELVDQRYATFLFAFSLPEEPLASILSERLDAITSGVLFPIFCAKVGLNANLLSITKASYATETILFSGYAGKFLGTLISSCLFGDKLSHALVLSIILSSKGLLDIASLEIWKSKHMLMEEDFTVTILHILILTGTFLPLIRWFYTPARQYSTILNRRSVITNQEHDTLQTLACIYKEENTPGIIRLLEICNPTRTNPMVVIALQLMQLTGRAALPVMAPLQQLTSTSAFRSNLARCNHIVNAFLHLERLTKGCAFLQHYLAMASYETMHNDICKLAYEKGVSLVILPFHARWGLDGTIEESSLSIREVNKKVFRHAPCSVGLLIDRGIGSQLLISDNDMYKIALLFVGGPDDHEAIAYSKIFTNHPNVRLVVVSLKGPNGIENYDLDNEVMTQFRNECEDNKRISYREVIVNDGSETAKVVMSMKDVVDLVIAGKHHDPNASAVLGLVVDGWTEYPELGLIGDLLASSDFGFSLLVVQQEPQEEQVLDNGVIH